MKMRHAAATLRCERIRVKELAHRLGYDDPYQFSRSFKRLAGLSPENYVLLAGRIILESIRPRVGLAPIPSP